MDIVTLLPITAVVAVGIFFAREVLEFFRRRSAEQRKIQALSHLLARECELNLWTIRSLRKIFIEVDTIENPNPQVKVTVGKSKTGRPYGGISSGDGALEVRVGIPKVHRDLMSKFLLDVATVDEKLFEVMEPAYDSLAELEHVREKLIAAAEAPEELGVQDYLEGLAGYALDQLEESEVALAKLYFHCTGEKLSEHRLR